VGRVSVAKKLRPAPETAKRGRGRPRVDNATTTHITLKVSEADREACERAARVEGKTLSRWARDALLLRAAAHGE